MTPERLKEIQTAIGPQFVARISYSSQINAYILSIMDNEAAANVSAMAENISDDDVSQMLVALKAHLDRKAA